MRGRVDRRLDAVSNAIAHRTTANRKNRDATR
jgi:hypothetical protein